MNINEKKRQSWPRKITSTFVTLFSICLVGVPLLASGDPPIFLPSVLVGVTATPTRVPSTRTPTPTAVGSAPTATSVGSSPTATARPSGLVSFPLGPGHADASTHQLIRTADDHAYLFAGKMTTNLIRVYRQTTTNLPASAAEFSQDASATVPSGSVISVDAAYDGKSLVYVVANTSTGGIYVLPYDTQTHGFRSTLTVATDGGQIKGDTLYAGTEGLATAVDLAGTLHIAYWTNGFRIRHCAVTYTNNQLSACTPFTVDAGGAQASHPAVAVSPSDGSLTVAWQSDPTSNPGLNSRVLARRRASNGTWGATETVSTVPPYYGRASNGNEVNVDNGPSLVITSNGARHLVFNQHFDSTGDYGRVIYVTDGGSGWTTTSLNWYSHASALAVGSNGQLAIIGHGGAPSTNAVAACKNNRNMCYALKPAGGSWGQAQLLAQYTQDLSYDGSPSTKWSAVGFNRPDVIEFAFFSIRDSTNGYYNPTLIYGRLP